MNIEQIRSRLKDTPNSLAGPFKYYSVLVPFIEIRGEPHIIFEVRSPFLRRQPGEICLPGGKRESYETFREAALRETREELNLYGKDIEIIGQLPTIRTHYNNIIYPFVGILHDTVYEDIVVNKSEVDEIFAPPLSFFINNPPLEHYIETSPHPLEGFPYHLIPNGQEYPWFRGKYAIYFYQYGERVIWGLTAEIIKILVDVLGK